MLGPLVDHRTKARKNLKLEELGIFKLEGFRETFHDRSLSPAAHARNTHANIHCRFLPPNLNTGQTSPLSGRRSQHADKNYRGSDLEFTDPEGTSGVTEKVIDLPQNAKRPDR